MRYQDKPADPRNYLPPDKAAEASEALALLNRLLAHPPPGVDVEQMLTDIAEGGLDQTIREHGYDPDAMPTMSLEELNEVAEYFEKKYPND